MKIVLMGYMGSGKSTIGKYIAKQLNLSFIDLDDYIETKEQSAIKDLFATKGEIYFRRKEAAYLIEILATEDNFVLSLGGGTPCYANSMEEILKSNAQSFYLKATIKTLFDRLRAATTSRPLIDNFSDEQLYEYLGKHLFERAPFYEQANHNISIDGLSVEEISEKIKAVLA